MRGKLVSQIGEEEVMVVDVNGTIVDDEGSPMWGVIERIRRLWEKFRLPVIVVTGRPESEYEETKKQVRLLGIPVREIVMRKEGDVRPPEEYKVREIGEREFVPAVVVDDNPEVLSAFGRVWSEVGLYQAGKGGLREVSLVECLIGSLKSLVMS